MADISDCSLYWQSVGTGKVKKNNGINTPVHFPDIIPAESEIQTTNWESGCVLYDIQILFTIPAISAHT